MQSRTMTAAILLAGLLPVYAMAQTLPRGYEIIEVTSGPLHQDKPRMNNAGQITFHSGPPGEPLEIVLYDRDGTLLQITNDNIYDAWPDIADDGTITWTRWIGPHRNGVPTAEIMMRTPDGQITRLTDNDVEDFSSTINSLRQVVWVRSGPVLCGGPAKDIFMFDGQRTIQITTDGLPETVENQSPEINDLSEICWTRYDFCDPPPGFNFTSKIMMHSAGENFELTDGQNFPQTPDLNNNSQVVWDHRDPDLGLDFIDLWDNGLTTTLVVDGIIPAINDRGHVAFNRWDHARSHWDIWLHRGGELIQITRDPFDNIVPDISDASEICWGANDARPRNIHYLRRFDAGDVNCDGGIDALDIEPFLTAMFDPIAYLVTYPVCDPLLADIDQSENVDALDIEPFIALMFP